MKLPAAFGFAVAVALCAAALDAAVSPASAQMEQNTDRPGHDYRDFFLDVADPQLCANSCKEQGSNCVAWTYVKPGIQGRKAKCWLKRSVSPARPNNCCVSGVNKRIISHKGSPAAGAGSRVLAYAQSVLGRCVNASLQPQAGTCAAPNGECTHLVEAAVVSAGARRPNYSSNPYNWGARVNAPYAPGDIIQFYNAARLEAPGGAGFWFTANQHTAIIERVNGQTLTVIDQNSPNRQVTRQNVNLGWNLVKGGFVVYRPQ